MQQSTELVARIPLPEPAAAAAPREPLLRRLLNRIRWFAYPAGLALATNLAAMAVLHFQDDGQFRQMFLAAVVFAALFGGWTGGLVAWALSFYLARWPISAAELRNPLALLAATPHYAVESLVVA